MPTSPLLEHDLNFVGQTGLIVGVDEAGRGALAGPVVAAAMALDEDFYNSFWCRQNSAEIDDSKKLSPARRDVLYDQFFSLKKKGQIGFSAGIASVAEIEKFNILGATKLAMQRALEGLQRIWSEDFLQSEAPMPLFDQNLETANFSGRARVFVDGNPLKAFPYSHQAIVHGDARSLAIAMASIVAKVTRDRIMDGLDARLPLYGFSLHKGYATRMHRQAILDYGASTEHRPTFLRKLYAGEGLEMEFSFDRSEKIS